MSQVQGLIGVGYGGTIVISRHGVGWFPQMSGTQANLVAVAVPLPVGNPLRWPPARTAHC